MSSSVEPCVWDWYWCVGNPPFLARPPVVDPDMNPNMTYYDENLNLECVVVPPNLMGPRGTG